METDNFIESTCHHGLSAHTVALTETVSFHLIASATLSLSDILAGRLNREVWVEVDGLNEHECSLLATDPVVQSAKNPRVINGLQITTPGNSVEALYRRICELVG